MLIRVVIVVWLSMTINNECVQSWTGINPSEKSSSSCSRRARRPILPPPTGSKVEGSILSPPTGSKVESSILPPPTGSKVESYSSPLPTQSSFRLLLPKNLDQPLDLYLESLAIKSEVIEGTVLSKNFLTHLFIPSSPSH